MNASNNSTLLSRRIQRGHRVVASVYPACPEPIERPFDGWTVYRIDACPKGEDPVLLQVKDAVQFERDPMVRDVIKENLIFAEQVVDDILTHWARTPIGAPPGSGPGIGLLEKERPSKQELDALYERQGMLFEWLYQEGLRLAQNQEWRGINRHHRLSAQWLGREEPWAIDTRVEPVPMEECPACGSPMPANKSICRSCGTVVRELPPEIAALQPGARRKAA